MWPVALWLPLRQLGLAADYLYAVEVVTVDEGGRAHQCGRDPESVRPASRPLVGAHRGGAGNFGVATRFWFRSPGASGSDPRGLLPPAPESITTFKAEWDWSDIEPPVLRAAAPEPWDLVRAAQWGRFANASLWALLELHRKQFGKIIVRGVSTAWAAAYSQVDDHLAALSAGIGEPQSKEADRMSWLEFALNPMPDLFAMPPGGVSTKVKDALLKRRLTDRQIGVVYDYLTARITTSWVACWGSPPTAGGSIPSHPMKPLPPTQRDPRHRLHHRWLDPGEEAKNLTWVRSFYRELFGRERGRPRPRRCV